MVHGFDDQRIPGSPSGTRAPALTRMVSHAIFQLPFAGGMPRAAAVLRIRLMYLWMEIRVLGAASYYTRQCLGHCLADSKKEPWGTQGSFRSKRRLFGFVPADLLVSKSRRNRRRRATRTYS